MADVEYTLSALSIDISRGGTVDDPTMTIVLNYTARGTTYEITAPDILNDDIRDLLTRVGFAVSNERVFSLLTGGDDFITNLIRA